MNYYKQKLIKLLTAMSNENFIAGFELSRANGVVVDIDQKRRLGTPYDIATYLNTNEIDEVFKAPLHELPQRIGDSKILDTFIKYRLSHPTPTDYERML
jgi:hypothetical protein